MNSTTYAEGLRYEQFYNPQKSSQKIEEKTHLCKSIKQKKNRSYGHILMLEYITNE